MKKLPGSYYSRLLILSFLGIIIIGHLGIWLGWGDRTLTDPLGTKASLIIAVIFAPIITVLAYIRLVYVRIVSRLLIKSMVVQKPLFWLSVAVDILNIWVVTSVIAAPEVDSGFALLFPLAILFHWLWIAPGYTA